MYPQGAYPQAGYQQPVPGQPAYPQPVPGQPQMPGQLLPGQPYPQAQGYGNVPPPVQTLRISGAKIEVKLRTTDTDNDDNAYVENLIGDIEFDETTKTFVIRNMRGVAYVDGLKADLVFNPINGTFNPMRSPSEQYITAYNNFRKNNGPIRPNPPKRPNHPNQHPPGQPMTPPASPYPQQYPGQPMQQYPGQPMQQYPGQPMQQYPGQPMPPYGSGGYQ
ncbi:hypothetical protein GPJ56_004007 [Histomonas meleagridis]|uniref:uncharacterized protein n=1 Tax=Histomonas meleagridis TaxID=135588 RepID=UPI00355966F2|nr:hypothetical protein GPJ56_004007 [Histomonas meleagridis]KAH0804871.1 hypothetical protein GO595_002321 [Histomonas meleagridis]